MAAGQAQLTDLPGGVVTRPGADQDGLTRPARTRPAQTRPTSRTAAVLPLPGVSLAYEVTGDGPAVVLVHGFGAGHAHVGAAGRAPGGPLPRGPLRLPRVRRLRARSIPPSPTPTPRPRRAARSPGHRRGGPAGLSFGGRVVLQTALAAPARVSGLVLLDAVLDGVPWDPDRRAPSTSSPGGSRRAGPRPGRAAWLAHPLFAAARQRPGAGGPAGGHGRRLPRPALARP